jgi:hypothetical protein
MDDLKPDAKERAGHAACGPGGDAKRPECAARPADQASGSNAGGRELSPAGCFGLLLLVLLMLHLAFYGLWCWMMRNAPY